MDVANEILDAIEIIVDKKIRENTAQIYPGVCKSVGDNNCVMSVNGRNNTVQFQRFIFFSCREVNIRQIHASNCRHRRRNHTFFKKT